MAKDLKGITMATLTLVVSIRGKLTQRVFTSGRMEVYMMVNGTTGSNMGMEFGKGYKMILILGNGRKQNATDLEFTLGQTEINMKESGRTH